MKLLIPSVIVFAISYFSLRSFKSPWEKGILARSLRYLLGVLSWIVLLSVLGIIAGFIEPMVQLLTRPSMGIGFLIGGLSLAASAVWKYSAANPELFDFPHMKPLIKESLTFNDPGRKRNTVFHDLELHEIRKVYREVTGKDPVADDGEIDQQGGKTLKRVTGREFAEDGRAIVNPREVSRLLAQPVESPALKEELNQLRNGLPVDITDSWKINSMKRSSHEWHKSVASVRLDPREKRMNLDIHSEHFGQRQIQDTQSLYRFKQDLYDFLQAMYQQDWMKPYLNHASTIACRCCHLSVDAFQGQTIEPLIQVEIATAVLDQYSNRFFNVAEMRSVILFGQAG